MYLDKTYSLQTGVALEISTISLRNLIEDVMAGKRATELAEIRSPADLCLYLSVIVHENAQDLVHRRGAWARKFKRDLLSGQPVAYKNFSNLFWRNLDEVDPDGDEWYRLTNGEQFHLQLINLLDRLRFIERNICQRQNAV